MELITTFKGSFDDLEKYSSIVVAADKFSIANDYTFSNKQIEGLVRLCKRQDSKLYILVNAMIYDEDLEDLKLHLEWIKSLSVDGIYFADLAVFMIARDLGLEHLLIYAPGMTVVNSEDVREYLETGIAGLELANELTLDEKVLIAKNNPNKVGIVISGYLLMSYSKRKVLKNYFNEIDKKMDLKDNYNLRLKERTREGLMPVYEDEYGSYIYSEYIFHSFKVLHDLKDVPFKYFRIDGIFLEQDIIEDLMKSYEAMILGRQDNFFEYILDKYPKLVFDDIFYTTETSEVKINE